MVSSKKNINPFNRIFKKKEFLKPLEYSLYKFPFYVDVELTNECNLNCIMCRRQIMKRPTGFMKLETCKKIIDEIALYDCGIRFVRQGEPTLHPQICEIVEYCNKKNVLNFISTNGFYSKEKIMKIFMSRPDVIRFSFQGLDAETFNKYRVPSKYKTVSDNIKICSEKRDELGWTKPFFIISTTITKETPEEVEKFKKKWLKYVDHIDVGKTTFSWVENAEGFDKDLLKDENVNRHYIPCLEVLIKLSVNWNGDITACCADQDGELIISNISKMSLKEAWESERENYIRERVAYNIRHNELDLCKDCFKGGYKFSYLSKGETKSK